MIAHSETVTVRVTELPLFVELLAALGEWVTFYGDISEWAGDAERSMVQLDHGHEEYMARIKVVAAARNLATATGTGGVA